jgi:hypothetical protein
MMFNQPPKERGALLTALDCLQDRLRVSFLSCHAQDAAARKCEWKIILIRKK